MNGCEDLLEQLVLRAQGEYLEMPGLRLTEAQAQRLWGLDEASCRAVLQVLVARRFLRRLRDGVYGRTDVTVDGSEYRRRRTSELDPGGVVRSA